MILVHSLHPQDIVGVRRIVDKMEWKSKESFFSYDASIALIFFYNSGRHVTYRKLFVDKNFLWTKSFRQLKSSVDSRILSPLVKPDTKLS